jgi:hypothetical protein
MIGAVGLFLLWSFMRNRPEDNSVADIADPAGQKVVAQKPVVPTDSAAMDTMAINDDLRGIFTTADNVFADIKDAASAEAARPELEELNTRIDNVKTMVARLPSAGIASVREMADKSVATFKDQAEKTLATPGLTDELKNLINQILSKMTELFAPAQP